MKEKYLLNKGDIKSLLPLGKKILVTLCIILIIKFLRNYLVSDSGTVTNGLIHEVFTFAPIEIIVKGGAIALLFLSITIFAILYLIKGKTLLKNNFIVSFLLFAVIDAIFIYIYPEILSAVINAVLLKE